MPEFFRRERDDGTLAPTFWTRIGGKRVTTGQKKLHLAKLWKERELVERADPRRAAAEKASLADAIRAMKAELKRRGRADGTLERCDQKLAHFPRLWGEHCKLSDITAERIGAYIDERLTDEGHKKGETVKRVTIRDELAFLRQLLKLARREGKYPYAIDDVMPIIFETGHKPRKDFVPESELQDLLDQLSPHRAAHILFFVVTAGRLADSFRARREDFGTEQALVRGSKTEGSYRTIPIEPFMRPLVKQMLKLAEDTTVCGVEVLFAPWEKIDRDLKAACVRAGIGKVSTNGLRRTFGTMHRVRGYSLETISKLYGHTTDKLARDVYADVDGAELKALMKTERSRLRSKNGTGKGKK